MVKYQIQKIKTPSKEVIDSSTGQKDYTVEEWSVYCNCTSVKEAQVKAKPLIVKLGVNNVQICKIVPSSVQIVFEED